MPEAPVELLHTGSTFELFVATGILAGSITSGITEQPYGDQRTVQEYREALEDLLRIQRASQPN